MKRLKIAQIKIAKMIRSTEFVARHNKTYTLSFFYTHKVTSPHRLETAIRNCVGKSQPYALTDDGPTAEQPQGAPIGRLAFPGLAKRARRGAPRGAAKDKSLPRVRRVTICAALQLHRSEKAPLFRRFCSALFGRKRKNGPRPKNSAPSGWGARANLAPKTFAQFAVFT